MSFRSSSKQRSVPPVSTDSTNQQHEMVLRRRTPRGGGRYRTCLLIVYTLIGLFMLAAGSHTSHSARATHTFQTPTVADAISMQTAEAMPISARTGTGNGTGAGTETTAPADWCLNPLDPSCWMKSIASWIAQQIMGALQPVIDAFNQSPLNIFTQTPPADTYQNPTVVALWSGLLEAVDLALACMIVIGGYHVMVGRQVGFASAGIAEVLSRLILAFFAAHFSLYFIGLFIDLNNALCSLTTSLAGLSMLTNAITAIFQGNLLSEGLLVVVLGFVLAVLDILLGFQMVVRLAMIVVLIALAGPGLACFALPQTISYGRTWLSLFSITVMVQFIQVVTLALGGMLVYSLGTGTILNLDSTLTTLFVSIAVLYLVLRIPGIVQHVALRPLTDASNAAVGAVQGAVGFVTSTVPRLIALLA